MIGIELKNNQEIRKLEFVSEEVYQTNILWLFTYLKLCMEFASKMYEEFFSIYSLLS